MKMHKFEKRFVNSNFCNYFHKKLIFPSFFKFINEELKGKALEIGCGIGKTTHFLSDKYNKLKITAIDYDKKQIDIAKKNKKSNKIEFKHGDATSLTSKNNSFDYVIETNVLHHIKNYEDAIKEARRVLRKNGHFYLMDISQYFFGLPLIRFLFPPVSYITKNILIEKLKENNFGVEKSKGNLLFFIAARKI